MSTPRDGQARPTPSSQITSAVSPPRQATRTTAAPDFSAFYKPLSEALPQSFFFDPFNFDSKMAPSSRAARRPPRATPLDDTRQYMSSYDILSQACRLFFNMDVADDAQPFENELSISEQWQADNPMPDGGDDADEYPNTYRREMETAIAAWTTAEDTNFQLYVAPGRACVKTTARRVGVRTVQLAHPLILRALRSYNGGITTDAKWFMLERNDALPAGSLRQPFDMITMDKYFRCSYTAEMIHAIGLSRLKQRNIPDGGFACQLGPAARAMLHVILIHAINAAGKLADNLRLHEANEQHPGFERVNTALRDHRVVRVGEEQTDENEEPDFEEFVQYNTHVDLESFFHTTIWNPMVKTLVAAARSLVATYLHNVTDNNTFTPVKPLIGTVRMLLSPDHQINHIHMLSSFTGTEDAANMFSTFFFRMIMAVTVHSGALTDQQVYHAEYPDRFEQSLLIFHTTFWHSLLEHVDDIPLNVVQDIRRGLGPLFDRGLAHFKARRAALSKDPLPQPRRTANNARTKRSTRARSKQTARKSSQQSNSSSDSSTDTSDSESENSGAGSKKSKSTSSSKSGKSKSNISAPHPTPITAIQETVAACERT